MTSEYVVGCQDEGECLPFAHTKLFAQKARTRTSTVDDVLLPFRKTMKEKSAAW